MCLSRLLQNLKCTLLSSNADSDSVFPCVIYELHRKEVVGAVNRFCSKIPQIKIHTKRLVFR